MARTTELCIGVDCPYYHLLDESDLKLANMRRDKKLPPLESVGSCYGGNLYGAQLVSTESECRNPSGPIKQEN